jgi:hypothetical protein
LRDQLLDLAHLNTKLGGDCGVIELVEEMTPLGSLHRVRQLGHCLTHSFVCCGIRT